ncbi:hypothetical protein Trydic_g10984 [Trypoxylus dichotomus]
MDTAKCLTPANSLTSLEKAKLCNMLMHKIKSTQSKKIILQNPAEPNDYTQALSVYPDTVVNIEGETLRSNRYSQEELKNKYLEEPLSCFEVDIDELSNKLRKCNVEDNLLEVNSMNDNTIKSYIDEERSDDEVSIIQDKEVIAHYKNYKSRTKTLGRKSGHKNFVNITQRKDQTLQGYVFYSMLLFLLCTFCLIVVFL